MRGPRGVRFERLATRELPSPNQIADLLAASDVLRTGWWAADVVGSSPVRPLWRWVTVPWA